MFRIGEFSKLTRVSVRMLRYYDEANLLKPAEVNYRTGYRMYSALQIPMLNRIVYLRDSGFNMSEIATLLAKNDRQSLVDYFNTKHAEIKKIIRSEQEKLEKINIAKKAILEQKDEMHYNISVKSIPGYEVISLRRIIPNYYAEGELWKQLSDTVEKNKLQVSGDSFSIYHDLEYKEKNVDVEICVPIIKTSRVPSSLTVRTVKPVQTMASTMVFGDFSNIAGAYRSFAKWLQKNSRYKMCGETRQLVHRGPWNEDNPKCYLTEIQIPLEIA